MKVLVATRTGQGVRKNDFCYVEAGDLVHFAMECDGEKVDGCCGCRRSMTGLTHGRATTTFGVADQDITREDFVAELRQSYLAGGWGETIAAGAGEEVDALLKLAGGFKVGAVLEKRGSMIRVRKGLTFSPGEETEGGK